LEAIKDETFYEGDNALVYNKEERKANLMMEQERKLQQENCTGSNVISDFEGLPLFLVLCWSFFRNVW
jgi:hypothetical protein